MDLHFDLQISGSKGAAIATLDAEQLASMTFSLAGEALIIIDHTDVDERLRGQGVGRKLLELVLNWTKENNRKILPLCPYAKSVFDKEPALRIHLK